VRITIDDVRPLYCVRGAKGWFADHGLDFRAFLAEGIDVETFLATGDERAQAVVRHKLRQQADLSGMVLTARDAQGIFCALGLRGWCREVGLDERRLFGEGVPATELLALNDVEVMKVIMRKLRTEGVGHGGR